MRAGNGDAKKATNPLSCDEISRIAVGKAKISLRSRAAPFHFGHEILLCRHEVAVRHIKNKVHLVGTGGKRPLLVQI